MEREAEVTRGDFLQENTDLTPIAGSISTVGSTQLR